MDHEADTDYNTALQKLMKECLPPILVEIVDKRPLDPIQYMADSLYNYKKKTERSLKNNSQVDTLSQNQLKSNHQSVKQNEKPVSNDFIPSKKITLDDYEDFETVNIRIKLHQDCLDIFTDIGDIFDEDDIS